MTLVHVSPGAGLWTGWFSDWRPVTAVGGLAAAYVVAARRGTTPLQRRCFAAGVGVLVIALMSPFDALSDELFAAHMVQHLLLAIVAPPLLVLAAPELVIFRGLPLSVRRRIGRLLRRDSVVRVIWRSLTVPIVAVSIHAIVVWLWHAPLLYTLALRNEPAHLLEHVSFIGTGMLLWWRIIHASRVRRAAYGVGILTLFATAMQTGVLGALLTLSHRVLYPAQEFGARAWGLSALDDQRLAGLLMWVVGGLLYVIAMSALFALWLSPLSLRRVRTALIAAGAAANAGCRQTEASSKGGGDVERGKQAIAAMGCGACHVIGGLSLAHGEVGPPLNGVSRRAIIGGALPNTPENMALWIEDPPAIAPNTAMPNLGVTAQSARDIVAYLYTLK